MMTSWGLSRPHPRGDIFSFYAGGLEEFATKWMDLDSILLSEISQSEKDRYCVISLIHRI